MVRTEGFIEQRRQGHGDSCSLGIEQLPIFRLHLLDAGITDRCCGLMSTAVSPSYRFLVLDNVSLFCVRSLFLFRNPLTPSRSVFVFEALLSVSSID